MGYIHAARFQARPRSSDTRALPPIDSPPFRPLRLYLQGQRARAASLAVLVVGTTALQVVNPLLLGRCLDLVTQTQPTGKSLELGGLFVACGLAAELFSLLRVNIVQTLSWTAGNRLRATLLRHCLSLDDAFLKSHAPGELIERVDGDVSALSKYFSDLWLRLASSLLLAIGVLVVIFIKTWKAGVLFLFFTMFALIALRLSTQLGKRVRIENRRETAKLYGFTGELLTAAEDLKALDAVPFGLAQFDRLIERFLRLWTRLAIANAAPWMSSIGVFGLAKVMALGIGGYLLSRGQITFGTIYLLYYYTDVLRRPLDQLQTSASELSTAQASVQRIDELFSLRPSIADGHVRLSDQPLSLEFKNVRFAYDTGHPVLEQVSFRLEAGEKLGIVGHTGAGKSSLIRLLLRSYAPTSGAILIDGQEVRTLELESLRSRVAVITQDVKIFAGTLRDNVGLFDASIPDARMAEVFTELGLGDWLRRLPLQLDTRVGEGSGFSAGEMQLVAMARAFLTRPGIVILDEASARMDPSTEAMLATETSRLLTGKTVITIAHRLSTLRLMDRVLVLEHGRIVESGRRSDLMANDETRFSQLLQRSREDAP